MSEDVEGIVRVVSGYNKIPDDGEQLIEVQYKLRPLKLKFLQTLFNINPATAHPEMYDLSGCFEINEEQARALQPYVVEGIIDLNKYDFMLECYAAAEDD